MSDDKTPWPVPRIETRYPMYQVCVLPGLGAVTRLEPRNGRIVAHTESGIDFIVPTFRATAPEQSR